MIVPRSWRAGAVRWTAVCVSALASLTGNAQPSPLPTTDSIYRAIAAAEDSMMAAYSRKDSMTMDRIIGDEFELTSARSTGGRVKKRGYISGGGARIEVESFRFHDMSVHVYGNVAVVHTRIDWKSTWNGERWDADFLMTDVWILREGRWQLVSRHSSYPATPERR